MNRSEPEAAVAIVRARGAQESILLIRRSERTGDSWSGHWSFPGGRRDPTDTDLLHTALRELEEECGVRLSRESVDTALPSVLARRRTGPFVLVAPFVFNVDAQLRTVVDSKEAVEAVWIPLSVWCEPSMHSLRCVPGLPSNWLFPAIDLKGVPVWGFTYRLSTDWLGLLPKQGSIEQAGFQTACRVLHFLTSHGMTLKSDWQESDAVSESAEPQRRKTAVVEGVIPAESLLAHFSTPGESFPNVNLLAIGHDHVRVVGLVFEEYLIVSSS